MAGGHKTPMCSQYGPHLEIAAFRAISRSLQARHFILATMAVATGDWHGEGFTHAFDFMWSATAGGGEGARRLPAGDPVVFRLRPR